MRIIGSIRLALVACALAAVTGLAAAGHATAATGDLTFERCLSDRGSNGACVELDLEGDPLDGAEGVAVSPDGRSVYVVSGYGESITSFRRASDGRLTYLECHDNGASSNCVDLPGTPLRGANGVAVSPDGKSVYVVSEGSDSIAHFFRGPGGEISFDGCLANDATDGCGDLPGAPLNTATAVAVSPDGRSVYVVSSNTGSIAHFFRGGPAGQIYFDGCLSSDGGSPCGDLPGRPLNGAHGVAVSPDGKSVWVASIASDSLARFSRSGPAGQITYNGCSDDDGENECAELPGTPLDGAYAVAVSPDGGSVYVAAYHNNSVARFVGIPAGEIGYSGCLGDGETPTCADLPGLEPLTNARAVAASSDGKSIYVAAFGGSLAHLKPDNAKGQILYGGCLNADGSSKCTAVPGDVLAGPAAVAVSPDGKSVYVAAVGGDSVAHFRRRLPAARPPARPPVDRFAPTISRLTVTKRRFRVRAAFRYRLSEPATVTVRIRRRARTVRTLRRRGHAGRNVLRFSRGRLHAGRYRAVFVATDAAGNRSTARTVRFRLLRGR